MIKKLWIVAATVIFFAGIMGILTRPVPMDRELPAVVFRDGIAVEETTITIEGSIRFRPFSQEADYRGRFAIGSDQATCREGTEARIRWLDDQNSTITFYEEGETTTDRIKSIQIDKKMKKIALLFPDGTIAATDQQALEQLWAEQFPERRAPW